MFFSWLFFSGHPRLPSLGTQLGIWWNSQLNPWFRSRCSCGINYSHIFWRPTCCYVMWWMNPSQGATLRERERVASDLAGTATGSDVQNVLRALGPRSIFPESLGGRRVDVVDVLGFGMKQLETMPACSSSRGSESFWLFSTFGFVPLRPWKTEAHLWMVVASIDIHPPGWFESCNSCVAGSRRAEDVPFYKPLLYQDEKRPGIPWGPQVGGWVFGFGCDVCMAWDSYSIRYKGTCSHDTPWDLRQALLKDWWSAHVSL